MRRAPSAGPRCAFPVLDAQKRAKVCGAPATTTRIVSGFDAPGVELDLCDRCAATFDAKAPKVKAPAPTPKSTLDWTQPIQVALWLVGLRLAFDDADGAALDMLRASRPAPRPAAAPPAPTVRPARQNPLRARLRRAPEDEHGDPAGSGGSGAE